MNSITTEEYLNFLKYHQITHLKTIELLTNDLLIRDYDIRLRNVFEYCQKTSNHCFAGFAPVGMDHCFAGFAPVGMDHPVNSNDFRDWKYQDILDWIKKTK